MYCSLKIRCIPKFQGLAELDRLKTRPMTCFGLCNEWTVSVWS